MNAEALIKLARAVIENEAASVAALSSRLDQGFLDACRFMLDCAGRVVVIGVGKSGHVGSKIAATLASTGTPAFFVHPAEASHGDLGMIAGDDVVETISEGLIDPALLPGTAVFVWVMMSAMLAGRSPPARIRSTSVIATVSRLSSIVSISASAAGATLHGCLFAVGRALPGLDLQYLVLG